MSAGPPSGKERADARAVLAPFERAERRSTARILLVGGALSLAALGGTAGWWWGLGELARIMLGFAGGAGLLVTLACAFSSSPEQTFARARALMDADLTEEAVALLKPLTLAGPGHQEDEPNLPFDTAVFLVAQAYDRAGATQLARAAYRHYLAVRPHGAWVIEARVRLEELEGRRPAGVDVVRERSAEEARCPYCKDRFEGASKTAACATCRTPHHAACYEEHGGCAVPGCGGDTVRVERLRA